MYTTEITFESLAQGDFSVIIDVDLDAINLTNITNDMTQDKEKAQEVITNSNCKYCIVCKRFN